MSDEHRYKADFDPIANSSVSSLCSEYDRLRTENPVFYWEEMKSWVITRHDDVASVLRDPQRFPVSGKFDSLNPVAVEALREAPSPWGTLLIGTSEGAEHDRLRKAVSNWFMPRRMKQMEEPVRFLVTDVVNGFVDQQRAELISALTYPVPIRVILKLLDFPEQDIHSQKTWSDQYLRILTEPMSPEEQRECAEGVISFQKYILDIVAARRARPGDDVFSELVQARERGSVDLTPAELVEIVFTLIFAGHETTAAMGANMIRHLLEDRRHWEKVQSDRSTIGAVVEEALRFDGPAGVTSRWVRDPVEIGGVTVQGRILVSLFAANHDGDQFECPAKFRPERTEKTPHFSFGFGTHYCLGAPLARLELRVMLEELLVRTPNLQLQSGMPLEYKPNASVRQLQALHVEW